MHHHLATLEQDQNGIILRDDDFTVIATATNQGHRVAAYGSTNCNSVTISVNGQRVPVQRSRECAQVVVPWPHGRIELDIAS